jgi:Stage II sporulation protein E (SpoIIE)
LLRRIRTPLMAVICLLGCGWAGGQSAPVSDKPVPPGQTFTMQLANTTQVTLGKSAVPLNGPWKFHVGDSPDFAQGVPDGKPLWAQPEFDDSKWETVDLTSGAGAVDPINGMSGYAPGWTTFGHAGYWGYAWYRIRVQLDARTGQKLALAGPADVDDVYQAYANGSLLGSFGSFKGKRPVAYYSQPMMFLLPDLNKPDSPSTADRKASIVIAVRIWMEPNSVISQPDAGGMHTAPVLGEAGAITSTYQLRWLELVKAYILRPVEGTVYLFLIVVVCGLMLFDRNDKVYRWLLLVFATLTLNNGLVGIGAWTQWVSYIVPQMLQDVVLSPISFAAWTMVWWVWFGLKKPVWVPKAIAGLLVLLMISTLIGEDFLFTVFSGSTAHFFHDVSLVLRLLFLLLMIVIVISGTKRDGIEGFLVLPAVVLLGISRFSTELSVLHIRLNVFIFGISISLAFVANMLLVVGLTVLLLRRLMLSVQAQRRMASDVKQAQEVQQVILPEARSIFPGLAIESEYRPAREVGGDFFQIIPNKSDGSVMIVAGDVTGKGLKAGMMVALLVGAIRSTVELNSDPEFMLQALNRRLIGRGESHATCLAMRIGADGCVTLANSGHMPPYLNGQAVAIGGSIPLGMMAEAECTVLRFQLADGDRLVLLSDGIVEAIDPNGQLFGFDRVNDLLQNRLSAAAVADAAQSFGQEDDISVISVTRMEALEAAMV